MSRLNKRQKILLIYWLSLVAAAEVVMLLLKGQLTIIYLIVAGLFFIGLGLRILNIYPGRKEPLMLDLSAVAISLLYAFFSTVAAEVLYTYLLIFTSSVIILPHLVYIVRGNDFSA